MNDITIEPTPIAELDEGLKTLAEHASEWANLAVDEKASLTKQLAARADLYASRWAEVAAAGKRLPPQSAWVGEEWVSGPWAFIEWCQATTQTLTSIVIGTRVDLPAVRALPDGRAAVQVFPANLWDSLLLNGVTAEVRMEPGVTPDNIHDHIAAFYRDDDMHKTGAVCVVLGAGNITSIPPLDTVYRMFVMGHVVMLKMSPVNESMGPVFEDIFAPLIERGWLRICYGGVEVGKHLTSHELVDELHLTGSEDTYDAIVFGVGPEGAKRKAAGEPLNERPITAELGGVGPSIVLPGGAWTKEDLRFQAENIVSQKFHNSGHNCVAAQVLVLPEEWEHSDTLIAEIEQVMRELPPREAWYPGADERQEDAVSRHAEHREVPNGEVPRTLLLDVPPDDDHFAFREEFFGVVLAVTRLPGRTPAEFWLNAVKFANDRLRGTLGCSITVHPQVKESLGDRFEEGIAQLRYGAIGVNIWNAAAFLLGRAAWGAYPGHESADIQSGSGFVHNALMFDKPAKTVVTGTFAPMPRAWKTGQLHMSAKPLWFVTNKTAHITAERLTHFAARPSVARLPGIFAAALRG